MDGVGDLVAVTKELHKDVTAMTSSSVPSPAALPFSNTTQQVLLGPKNTVTKCNFCRSSIKTAVKYTTTARTHIAAALCGAFLCCCMPYCANSAKNTDHYCPNCQRYLGTYNK